MNRQRLDTKKVYAFIFGRGTTIAIVVILIAASLIPITAGSKLTHPRDDAYITFVYARSLANGDGFRTHPNAEPSLGTTAPFWAIILAIASKLFPFIEMSRLAMNLSIGLWIATGWLWAWKGSVFGLNRLSTTGITILILTETTFWITHVGMESWLFCFLLTLCVMLYFNQQYIWSGVVGGLLFLTRGEGLLIVAAFAIYQGATVNIVENLSVINRPAQRIARTLIGFFSIVVPWAIIALLSLGRVLPHTLQAKSLQVELGFVEAFSSYTLRILTLDWSNLGLIRLGYSQSPTQISTWLALACVGFFYAIIFHRKLLVFVIWIALFTLGYVILKAPGYTWYPLPIIYILTIFAALALTAVGEITDRLAHEIPIKHFRLIKGIPLILLMIVLASILPSNVPPEPIPNHAADDYTSIAEWSNANTPRGSTIAYLEVGTLAWHSNRQIVDLLGLISPELLPFVSTGDYAAAFQSAQPDYLVYIEPFGWALDSIIRSDFFEANYTEIERMSTARSEFQSTTDHYTIFERMDGSIAAHTSEADFVFDFASPPTQTNGIRNLTIDEDGTLSADVEIDPYLYQLDLAICADDYSHIILKMSTSEPLPQHFVQIFYTPDTTFREELSLTKTLADNDDLNTYIIGTFPLAGWHGRLNGLRIDPVNTETSTNYRVRLEEFRLIRRDGPSRCTE